MSSQSNTLPASFEPRAVPPSVTANTRPLYWCVRRELWENRAIYVAPLVVAAVALLGFLIATLGRALSTPDLAKRLAILEEPLTFAMGVLMATTYVVGIFYCLDALHSERRDRSILFWKSLPVSDFTVVLSKAIIPFVVLPVLTMVMIIALQWVMLLVASLVVAGSGLSVSAFWANVSLPRMTVMLGYHLFTAHVLWYAPIYTYMLLISGWVRRAAFLWAALPPVAIGVIEKVAFNTRHFSSWMLYRFAGPQNFDFPHAGNMPMQMAHLDLAGFFSTPGLWAGLLLAAIFFVATVRLRRVRGPL